MATFMREYPRIESDVQVEYESDGDTLQARALNLGGGGMYLDLAHQPLANSQFSVRFRAARHMAPIQARAEARYDLAGQGVGLQFTDIEPADRARILHLIVFRRGNTRENPRARMVTQVEHAGGMFLGFSRAISAEGMFIETKEEHPVGSNLCLRFRLSEVNDDPVIVAAAKIAYVIERAGVGITFSEIAEEDRQRIQAFASGSVTPGMGAGHAGSASSFAACA